MRRVLLALVTLVVTFVIAIASTTASPSVNTAYENAWSGINELMF